MRFLIKIFLAGLVLILVAGGNLWWWASQPLTLRSAPLDFRIAAGGSLRTAIVQMKESGIEVNGFLLALLARVQRADTAIKAGSYAVNEGVTPHIGEEMELLPQRVDSDLGVLDDGVAFGLILERIFV